MDMHELGKTLARQDLAEITTAYDRTLTQSTQTLGRQLAHLVQHAHRDRISRLLYRVSIYSTIGAVTGVLANLSPHALSAAVMVAIAAALLSTL